jgi:hypothetical protein
VKPANLGSSSASTRSTTSTALRDALDDAFRYDRRVIVEAAVDGRRELEVAVLGNDDPEVSPVGEIRYDGTFYDYHAKYTPGAAQLLIPAPVAAASPSEPAPGAARLRGDRRRRARPRRPVLRRPADRLYVNEINTMPGFTATSMYPRLWAAAGVAYDELIERLVAPGPEPPERQPAHDAAGAAAVSCRRTEVVAARPTGTGRCPAPAQPGRTQRSRRRRRGAAAVFAPDPTWATAPVPGADRPHGRPRPHPQRQLTSRSTSARSSAPSTCSCTTSSSGSRTPADTCCARPHALPRAERGPPQALRAPAAPAARRVQPRNVFRRDDQRCQYCGERAHDLTLDHVVPRSRGGPTSWENVVACCRAATRASATAPPKRRAWRCAARPGARVPVHGGLRHPARRRPGVGAYLPHTEGRGAGRRRCTRRRAAPRLSERVAEQPAEQRRDHRQHQRPQHRSPEARDLSGDSTDASASASPFTTSRNSPKVNTVTAA